MTVISMEFPMSRVPKGPPFLVVVDGHDFNGTGEANGDLVTPHDF
jgi:hypothetical protein